MPIFSHTYENGLVLVAEPMGWLESAAFNLMLPTGAAYDPDDRCGLGSFCCELALRGSGSRDSRQFVEDLENLGVETGESVSVSHTSFGGATVTGNLFPALAIFADLVRRPHFPPQEVESIRQLIIQELRAIEDEPAHKVLLEVRRHFYPEPWGRSSQGELQALQEITLDDARRYVGAGYRPNGAILGVAGRIDWPKLRDEVGKLLGDWPSLETPEPAAGAVRPRRTHLHYDSNQTQIGIAYPCVPYRDPNYFQAWGAVNVLSGGMSSRLFTEVREKRGLCYSVHASCHTLRDRGSVLCYAGTSADRAQETLDVTLAEIVRLSDGVEPSELARLKARMKSALILQEESSAARSSAIARDWYLLGHPRTLDEIGALVDALECDGINAYLAANPPRDFCIVTLGPQPLETPRGIS